MLPKEHMSPQLSLQHHYIIHKYQSQIKSAERGLQQPESTKEWSIYGTQSPRQLQICPPISQEGEKSKPAVPGSCSQAELQRGCREPQQAQSTGRGSLELSTGTSAGPGQEEQRTWPWNILGQVCFSSSTPALPRSCCCTDPAGPGWHRTTLHKKPAPNQNAQSALCDRGLRQRNEARERQEERQPCTLASTALPGLHSAGASPSLTGHLQEPKCAPVPALSPVRVPSAVPRAAQLRAGQQPR